MATGYRPLALFAALAAMGFSAAPAHACRGPFAEIAYLHRTLPEEAAGDFAAEVEILASDDGPDGYFFTARIIRLLRGKATSAKFVNVVPQVHTDCDRFPGVGEKGILIGRIVSSGPDEIGIDPIPAPRGSHIRE